MNQSKIQSNETGHEPKAFFIAFLVYCALLALLFFWEIKFKPPLEPLGIEVNFGTDDIGSGNIQTTNKASDSKNNYDVKPPNSESEAKSKQQVKTLEPKPIVKTIKTPPTKTTPDKVITSKEVSKVVVKEVSTPPKVTSKPVESNSKSTNTKTVPEPVKSSPTPTAPTRTADAGSLFGKGKTSGGGINGTTGTRDGEGGNNNGDNKSGVGDKGNPNGTIDGKSMYGTPGKGGTGSSITGFSGWKRGKLNLSNDNSDETGKIVFRIKVDDQGHVISISAIEKTVSPSVVEFYKNQISKKMNSILDSDGNPPPISEGTITIIINN